MVWLGGVSLSWGAREGYYHESLGWKACATEDAEAVKVEWRRVYGQAPVGGEILDLGLVKMYRRSEIDEDGVVVTSHRFLERGGGPRIWS